MTSALDSAAQAAFDLCSGTPGAVVGVRTGGGIWFGAYGTADPDVGSAIGSGTHLRIGSVTKTFTATLLLQSAAEGELNLDAPISDFVADVPDGDRVTLRLLATMRSGIADYTADPAIVARIIADPTAAQDPADMIAGGLAASPVFEPGGQFAYSNTNYLLLAQVLESATGATFGALLSERILNPLGLLGTWWPASSSEIPQPYARGFTMSFPGATAEHPVEATGFNPAWAGAAGALVSTPADLLTFSRALATGTGLLDPHTHAERVASLAPAPSLGTGVRYGIGLMDISGWLGHSGDIPGYRSSCYFHPDAETSLVVVTSSDIVAGRCPETAAAMTIATDATCMSPTARIFDAVSDALGHPSRTPTSTA